MSFPNHSEKYGSDPVVTPERSGEYAESVADADRSVAPRSVVLCFSRGLMDYVTEEYAGQYVGDYYADCYVLEDTAGDVGVVGNFGIGAPTTAMVMEDLIADGAETFLAVGFAGCLDEDVGMGEYVVPDAAIRDEGTSHHYVESGRGATPSRSLASAVETSLREGESRVHVGPTWSIDAVYRETAAEVRRYAREGVLTVEMEAAAVFVVAEHRGVEAAAAFVVSDYLGPGEWDPAFHRTEADLRRLVDAATDLLAARGR